MADPETPWLEKWLAQVASGASTMSQRSKSSVLKKVSLQDLKKTAKRLRVHIVETELDDGKVVYAASKRPFKVIA